MPEENTAAVRDAAEVTRDYKKTALKVGVFFLIVFILRYVGSYTITAVSALLGDHHPYTAKYIVQLTISFMFLQVAPAIIGAYMFGWLGKGGTGLKVHYRIPKSNTRAIGNFPAVYGAGAIVNVVTLIIMFFCFRDVDLTKRLNAVSPALEGDIWASLYMFFVLVVIAPVFEEFVYRGVLMDALKPYGNGLAIFATGIMFGIAHANFQQLFYTMVIGICLGYIANVTGSIFSTTIIHAMVNGVSGIMILLMSTNGVQEFILNGNPDTIPDEDMIWVAVFGIFMVSIFIFMIVGFISAVLKIKQIKKYKVKKVCPEITNGKKTALLLTTVPAVITLIMVIDTLFGISSGLVASMIQGA